MVQCSVLECSKLYHISCLDVSTETLTDWKQSGKIKTWRCCPDEAPKKSKVTLEDIYNLVKTVQLDQRDMREKMEEVAASQAFLSAQYDEIQKQLDKHEKAVAEVDVLRAEVQALREENADRSRRQAHQEQYSRRHHLEIHNVQHFNDENIPAMMVRIAAELGVDMTEGDVEVAHRLKTSDKKKVPGIIVELGSRRLRNDIIARRYTKEMTNKSLFRYQNTDRVFVTESLSPFFKKLLWQAKQKAKEMKYKHCWFSNSKILARQDDKSTTITILNEQDIQQIK